MTSPAASADGMPGVLLITQLAPLPSFTRVTLAWPAVGSRGSIELVFSSAEWV